MPVWSAPSSQPGDRKGHEPLACCPACRAIEERGTDCPMCGSSWRTMIPLPHGLASLADGDVFGLVHYPGDRSVKRIALGMVVLFPLTGVAALVADVTVPGLLFALAILGLPALALLDARRAGIVRDDDSADSMPRVAPELMLSGPARAALRYLAPFRGKVRRLARSVTGPVSRQIGVIVRCDIRAGADAEILARAIASGELLVESEDGTSVLVSGPIEIDASSYSICRDARAVKLCIADTALLPAEFSAGGWACELLVRDGDEVEVYGWPSGEERPHPLGAGYRSAATVALVSGAAGRPVRVHVLPGWNGDE